MQIKNTMRYHCTSSRMSTESLTILSVDRIQSNWNPHTQLWECKIVQPLQNIYLPYDPAIPLLNIYPGEMKADVYTKTMHNVHSSFIFNSQKLEKAKCQSMGEWMDELGYIHTMEYHSATKRDESLIYTTRINLQIIMLSERRQAKKRPCCMIPFI